MSGAEALRLARFWGRVEVGFSNQCWPWKGRANPAGYGRFEGSMAHRMAYELINGPIPEDLIVRHRCDNPPCCNPKHLLLGTQLDNMGDAVERKRIAHSRRNGRTKLTEEDVHYIRRNPDRLTGRAMAERYGIARSTISYIQSGRSWKWVVGAVGIEPTSSPCDGDAKPLS